MLHAGGLQLEGAVCTAWPTLQGCPAQRLGYPRPGSAPGRCDSLRWYISLHLQGMFVCVTVCMRCANTRYPSAVPLLPATRLCKTGRCDFHRWCSSRQFYKARFCGKFVTSIVCAQIAAGMMIEGQASTSKLALPFPQEACSIATKRHHAMNNVCSVTACISDLQPCQLCAVVAHELAFQLPNALAHIPCAVLEVH
eukprot:1161613-Pelagomonas_calceolata.AAC.5